jgi:hypothetical protein
MKGQSPGRLCRISRKLGNPEPRQTTSKTTGHLVAIDKSAKVLENLYPAVVG